MGGRERLCGARSGSVQVLRTTPPPAKTQSAHFTGPTLIQVSQSGARGSGQNLARTGQPPEAPTSSKPFPTPQPNCPSALTFQAIPENVLPHPQLSHLISLCSPPGSYLSSPTGILAVPPMHQPHPASGPLHWFTKFVSYHSDGLSMLLTSLTILTKVNSSLHTYYILSLCFVIDSRYSTLSEYILCYLLCVLCLGPHSHPAEGKQPHKSLLHPSVHSCTSGPRTVLGL